MFFGHSWRQAAILFFSGWLGGAVIAAPAVCPHLLASPVPGASAEADEIHDYFSALWAGGTRSVFLFAIGGGNDTFSSLIPTVYLKEMGFSVHAFGVLSPTAHHAPNPAAIGQPETPLLEVGPTFTRQLLTRPPRLIRNTERVYPDVAARLPRRADSMHLLSAKFPPGTMTAEIGQFIDATLAREGRTRKEAIVVLADFGADVLSRGEGTTISPDLDAAVLRWAMHLPTELKKISWLFWPGVDGELSPRALREALEELAPHIKARAKISSSIPWMTDFKSAIDELVAPIRTGNTIRLAFEGMGGASPSRAGPISLRKGVTVGTKKISKEYAIELDPELVSTTYLVDAAKLYDRNPFAQIDYRDGLDFFLRIQKVYRDAKLLPAGEGVYAPQNGSDYLLQYLTRDASGLWSSRDPLSNEILQLAITPNSMTAEETKILLTEALALVTTRQTDVALFSLKQLGTAELPAGSVVRRSRHYVVVGHASSGKLVDDLFGRLTELGE